MRNTRCMGSYDFDLCVVGAGSAGYAAATTARGLGKSVVLADGEGPLAGLCILRGCMPSKTLLRSAEIAHLVRTAPELGVRVGEVRYDVPHIVRRKRRIIADFAADRVDGIRSFPLFQGRVRFTGRDTLAVGEREIRARRFVIATGSVINIPPIPGLAEAGYITSDEVLDMEELPSSIVVLGGGAVAVELAQYLARLGCRTTILQRSATLLSGEDHDVGTALREALTQDGIRVVTDTALLGATRNAKGKCVRFRHAGRDEEVCADEIFVALGRRPNVDAFGFEVAGVAYDAGGVRVDPYLRTTNPVIYAAGDVTGAVELVHVAVYGGAQAARNAFSENPQPLNYDLLGARAVFTDPQVGVAGLSEKQCRERGIAYVSARYPFAELGKAITAGLTQGFVKMLAAPDARILGVTIVGAEAADLIHEAIALLYFKARTHDVMEMPHLHPTLAEIMTYPAEELCERLEHEAHAVVTP
jgi:pyruvate/2-oxoglutarate dehydrogenase complex dihydrolipoamide dehydrogenase (E3) component